MTLIEQINNDYLKAYKARDELRVSVLRLLKTGIKNAEIALRHGSGPLAKKEELTDSELISTLKKEIKQRKDSIEAYEKAGKKDAAEKEAKEIKIISAYLPDQLNEGEIIKIAEETISEIKASGMADMGRVIGIIMSKYGDNVNGGTVSRIVKELLNK